MKKNIESNASVFALGGMEIGIASALLVLKDIPLLSITSTPKKAGKKRTLPIWSAKCMLRNIFAAVAIIILSPVLFIISAFILASSVRNGLINHKRTGDNAGRPHKVKIINMLLNVAANKDKYRNPDRSNFPETISDGSNISVTGDDEILRIFDKSMNEGLFSEPGLTFSDKEELYERMKLERILVNPVRIMAWQILPEGIMLNPDNWVEKKIKYGDIRIVNNNAALFLKTFQHVLLTKC